VLHRRLAAGEWRYGCNVAGAALVDLGAKTAAFGEQFTRCVRLLTLATRRRLIKFLLPGRLST
jgi:hypothetical protein